MDQRRCETLADARPPQSGTVPTWTVPRPRRPPSLGLLFLLVLALAPAAVAQPTINSNGIVNAASFLPPTVPGGAIAQGSIFSVFGEDLGPKGLEAREFPIPTELGGVRVEILTTDNRTLAAPLLFVGTSQINAILPSDTPVGSQQVHVIRDGVESLTVGFKVVESSVGIFTEDNIGLRQPAGLQLLESARPGDRVTLWLTGLGPIEASDAAAPPVGDLPVELRVIIGDRPAEIEYQGRSGCCAGLDQVNVFIPEDAPLGCFVPLWVEVNEDLYSNIASVSTAPPGRECWRTDSTLAEPFVESITGRLGLTQFTTGGGIDQTYEAFYARSLNLESLGTPPGTATNAAVEDCPYVDCPQASQATNLKTLYPFPTDDPALLPPPGLCRAGSGAPELLPGADGGFEFVVNGPLGETTLAPSADPPMALTANPPFALSPGGYDIESVGGPDLGPFTASLTIPPAPIWDQASVTLLERTRGVTEQWSGGAPDAHAIVSRSPVQSSAAGEQFICRGSIGEGAFEIPAAFLANVPAAQVELSLTSMPTPAEMEFATDGLENGLVIARDTEFRNREIGPPRLASSPVTLPNGNRIQAELATGFGERQRGLMSRPAMPADQGMLFFFERPGVYRFWMFQTLIPLDIIWLDSDRRIIFINAHTPPCPPELGGACPTFGPNEFSQFVLELNAGEAAARGLAVGDQLTW